MNLALGYPGNRGAACEAPGQTGRHAARRAGVARRAWPRQIAAAARGGIEVVVVHGGGKQMTRFLAERGIESRFVNGLRVTTPETIDAVLKVFAGSVNHELVASLNRAGALRRGTHRHRRACWPNAEQMDPGAGRGRPRGALQSGAARSADWRNGYLPVVACVAGDRQGHIYNVNADQMAVACAAGFARRPAHLSHRCGRRARRLEAGAPELTAAESRSA